MEETKPACNGVFMIDQPSSQLVEPKAPMYVVASMPVGSVLAGRMRPPHLPRAPRRTTPVDESVSVCTVAVDWSVFSARIDVIVIGAVAVPLALIVAPCKTRITQAR